MRMCGDGVAGGQARRRGAVGLAFLPYAYVSRSRQQRNLTDLVLIDNTDPICVTRSIPRTVTSAGQS